MAVLLVVIYLAFIGLGLPDSLLGSAWPVMHLDINAPLSAAGFVGMIVCGGTVISSLTSNRLIHAFGTGRVTAISVLLTAIALLGISFAPSLIALCLWAIPLGIGAGSVDAALNNFVAMHYKARHMSWLHCFWGIGATMGPLVMSFYLGNSGSWRLGYRSISYVQFLLVIVLLGSLSLWKKAHAQMNQKSDAHDPLVTNSEAFRVPGVKYALLAFLCYCGSEVSAGLWAASYLVEQKGLLSSTAAAWASFYYAGITVGRFLSGFISMKLTGKQLIRYGCAVSLMGAVILLLPMPAIFSLLGFVLIGLGGAPFYPSMIHETPHRFGKRVSQAAMGLQMASAYVGSTFMPLLVGLLSRWASLSLLPWILSILIGGMFLFSERIAKATRQEG